MAQIALFFYWCSGANTDYLSSSLKSERVKLGSIGVSVFITGIFAWLTGWYAVYQIFKYETEFANYICFGFGVLWGGMIFNLDRYIVSTMKKNIPWWKQLLMASIRLLIATSISFLIATPLEAVIFKEEIQERIRNNEINKVKQETRQSQEKVGNLEDTLKAISAEMTSQHLLKGTIPSEITSLQSQYFSFVENYEKNKDDADAQITQWNHEIQDSTRKSGRIESEISDIEKKKKRSE